MPHRLPDLKTPEVHLAIQRRALKAQIQSSRAHYLELHNGTRGEHSWQNSLSGSEFQWGSSHTVSKLKQDEGLVCLAADRNYMETI